MDKSPSLRAIAYDFNKLAQDVKEDTQLPELLARNDGAIENELIASGVNLEESNGWRNVRVFWKRMKDRMQDSDEYRRWLQSSSPEEEDRSAKRHKKDAIAAAPQSENVRVLLQEVRAEEHLKHNKEKEEMEQKLEKAVRIIVCYSIILSQVPYLISLYLFVFQRNEVKALKAKLNNVNKERMLMNATGRDTMDPAPPKENTATNLQHAAPDSNDKVGGEDGAASGFPVSQNDESKLALDTTNRRFDNTNFKVGDHVFDKKLKSSCLGSIIGFYADSDDAQVSWDCGKVWDAKSRHNIANLTHASAYRRNRTQKQSHTA